MSLEERYHQYLDYKLPDGHKAVSSMMCRVGEVFTIDGKEYKLTVKLDTNKHNEMFYKFSKVEI